METQPLKSLPLLLIACCAQASIINVPLITAEGRTEMEQGTEQAEAFKAEYEKFLKEAQENPQENLPINLYAVESFHVVDLYERAMKKGVEIQDTFAKAICFHMVGGDGVFGENKRTWSYDIEEAFNKDLAALNELLTPRSLSELAGKEEPNNE